MLHDYTPQVLASARDEHAGGTELRPLRGPSARLSRRKGLVCRVCATQDAQTFLRDALTNRRRRGRDLDELPEH